MPKPPGRIGVAVSGGGDSVALLCLITEFAKALDEPMEVHAVSIDHGLREAAADEVRAVTELCGELGVSHHVEYWQRWDGNGNLMAEARNARYGLLADWAHANGVGVVALGHTANDQAETLLMRLARGSGVDGLSAMSVRRAAHGITWLRPLLNIERRELRYYLQNLGVTWVEDPTNEDRDFERIRMRDALRLLEPLGLDVPTLGRVAQNMTKAREALDWQTFLNARDVVRVSHGALAFDLRRFRTLPEEIRRRMLLRAFMWLSGSDYGPRRSALDGVMDAIHMGRTMTLDGSQIMRDGEVFWIHRELNAVEEDQCEVGDLWDNRWIVNGPEEDPEYTVKALGYEALSSIENWRDLSIPRSVLAVTPAVFVEGELVAAPLLKSVAGWTATLESGQDAFFATLLSH